MEGTLLGPYRILARLGAGAMGMVYRAEVVGEVAGLEPGMAVAVKVIHAHLLESPALRQRFQQEAEVGRTIRHENVVRCFDSDALLQGEVRQVFLVMEYMEGQTIRDLLEELERVPEDLCRQIGRDVARGLAAIHAAGVVHRDIKPDNVLISASHVVKVMDLGVAQLKDVAIRLSQTGEFVGSPEYAAPEQYRSEQESVDGRADLHALGVMLYECSTGRSPFRDADLLRVIHRVLEEVPQRVGGINPQLSPFFEEVVQTLLAKDRKQRFRSAANLARVLEEGERSSWWQERAKAIRVQTRRPLRRIRIPRETPLYGRDEEIARLRALYQLAKGGAGHVLLLEGEAGIGKTRLVDEFVGRLQQEGEDLDFLFGSYPPGGAATMLGAFQTAYCEHFGAEGLAEVLEEYLKPTPILIPAFAALLKGESTPPGAVPLTKDSLQTVFVHATRTLASGRPTIVLIDDLHFAPEEGRALFASLALSVPGHRILLVGTMRPGVPEAWTADVARFGHTEHRMLARLGPKDLALLLEEAFRSKRLANELGMQIAMKCDGNPFFTFEIIRGLREGQFISQRPDGSWRTTKSVREIQVPSSVADLVWARIVDLEDDERNVLDVASCCGFEFEGSLVGEVLGLPRVVVLQKLARIETRTRLVRSLGRHYAFDHPQLHDALYEALNGELREEYHALIAQVYESRARVGGAEPKDAERGLAVKIAEHYVAAGRGSSARPWFDEALERLGNEYQNARAIRLCDLMLADPRLFAGKARVAVLLRLAALLDLIGQRTRQQEVIEAAIGIAREIGDRRSEGTAAGNLGTVLRQLGRHAEAQERHERSLALACEIDDRRAEAIATGNLGIVIASQGRYPEAQEHFESSLAIWREIGSRQGEANVTGNLGNLLRSQGHLAEARDHFERALVIHRELGNRQAEATVTGNLGSVFYSLGYLAQAQEIHERSLAISREIGHRQGEAVATGNLGVVFFSQGRLAEAWEHYDQGLAICQEIGNRQGEAIALHNLGNVAREEGDPAGSEERWGACLGICEEIGHRGLAAATRLALGSLHAAGGDLERAREALTLARDLATAVGTPGVETLARCELAMLPGGNASDALAAFAEHEAHLEADERIAARWLLWKATGDLAHLEGAKQLLDESVARLDEATRELRLSNLRVNREIVAACTKQEL